MSKWRNRSDPGGRLAKRVYYESQLPPVRVCIGWMRVNGFRRGDVGGWACLTREQQAAVELAWERLEQGEMVGDIGACVTY